jgi:hypothetical protein
MKASVLIVASLLIAGSAVAGEPPTVPKELQSGWGLNGHCNKTAERLEVNAYRAGWGGGYGGPIHYDAARRALIWDDEKKTDVFYLGAAGKQMFHEKTPGGERERLVKCPGSLMKYAGH